MAMTAGSVSIDGAGVATKSGLAEAIYDQLILIPTLLPTPVAIPTGGEGAAIKRNLALQANALATALVTYFQANMQAKITTSQSGLQLMPASTAEDTPCKAPASNKFLAIV